jgi:hypothetical protein
MSDLRTDDDEKSVIIEPFYEVLNSWLTSFLLTRIKDQNASVDN